MKFLSTLIFIFSAVCISMAQIVTSDQNINMNESAEDLKEYEIEWPEYEFWNVVTLQGKLKMQGLPVTPSVKIFMQNDSIISLSLRAPFVGEVGRLDINPTTITIVNKMNKTYVSEDISALLQFYPGGISDIQDLLLGRFFLPGFDINTADLDQLVDFYYDEGKFNLVPKGAAELEGIKYGFTVDRDFRPLLIMILPEKREDIEIAAIYDYDSKGYDLRLAIQANNALQDLTFEFKNPEWKGEMPAPVDTSKKYKKLSFDQFFKSIGR